VCGSSIKSHGYSILRSQVRHEEHHEESAVLERERKCVKNANIACRAVSFACNQRSITSNHLSLEETNKHEGENFLSTSCVRCAPLIGMPSVEIESVKRNTYVMKASEATLLLSDR